MHIHAAMVPPVAILEGVAAALAGVRVGSTELIPVDHLQLVLAGFGNVTAADSARIRAALVELAASMARPTVYFVSPDVVDADYGQSVVARFEGDLDAMALIAKEMTRRVESLGFYVDRRRLHPWLEVARSKGGASPSDVVALEEALQALVGRVWEVADFQILATFMDSSGPRYTEIERIPLGAEAGTGDYLGTTATGHAD